MAARAAWERAGPGGGSYGDVLAPTTLGSAGGNGGSREGGAGGGTIRLAVSGTLRVDGMIKADGLTPNYASGHYPGGGAGGSVWLTAGTLTGSGSISASGASSGSGSSGGGAGGRIALCLDANTFNGTVSAIGGYGGQYGGAGTIYRKASSQTVGELLVDNNRITGNWTPLASPAPFHLIVSTNVLTYAEQALTVTSLRVAQNAVLSQLGGTPRLELVVLGNTLVESGARVLANGVGYPRGTNQGPGVGVAGNYGSGAGYGGAGGRSQSGAAGGGTYGSAAEPTALGSQGGAGSGGAGGAGGGAIRLEVGGTLRLTGSIQANGNDGVGHNSGGGSGGSVFLTASHVTGAGTISAQGGTGKTPTVGGGGGGGRIAVHAPNTTGFNPATQITVAGGAGYAAGTSGTVFLTNAFAPLEIVSHAPVGVVGSPFSHADLTFSAAILPESFSGQDVTITQPGGAILQAQITVSPLAGRTWRLAFPSQPNQALEDQWQFQIGPDITGLLGQPMPSAYTFTLLVREITLTTSAQGDALRLTWPSVDGLQYQVLATENLRTWTNYGTPLLGNGGMLLLEFPWTNTPRQFFRVRVAN